MLLNASCRHLLQIPFVADRGGKCLGRSGESQRALAFLTQARPQSQTGTSIPEAQLLDQRLTFSFCTGWRGMRMRAKDAFEGCSLCLLLPLIAPLPPIAHCHSSHQNVRTDYIRTSSMADLNLCISVL